jgi:hypothetical protein
MALGLPHQLLICSTPKSDVLTGVKNSLNTEGLAVTVVEHIQQSKRPTINALAVHEVQRPHFIAKSRHTKLVGFFLDRCFWA